MKTIFTADEVTDAVVRCLFPPRRCVVVPNVSWGFGIDWEADLMVVTPRGYATEIEVKVSVSDYNADFKKKKHCHILCSKIGSFAYAMPEQIWVDAFRKVPEHYGLILVGQKEKSDRPYAYWKKRPPKFNQRKVGERGMNNLMRLGYLRMWALREKQAREKEAYGHT